MLYSDDDVFPSDFDFYIRAFLEHFDECTDVFETAQIARKMQVLYCFIPVKYVDVIPSFELVHDVFQPHFLEQEHTVLP